MSIQITCCGLTVIPDRESQGWECGNFWEELATLDLADALNFTRARIRDMGQANGHDRASFIAAAFHPGWVPQLAGLEYADQPVDVQEEREHHGDTLHPYTVCGFYPDTWQTYSGYHEAISPRMAYWDAWLGAQAEDRYLYVANVHPGCIQRYPIPGIGQAPAFGHPSCQTAEEMAAEMDSLLGV